MPSNCFTPIRGRRMRVTLVDKLGRPVPGACSNVVTSGFVNVQMTAEVEAGEETTVKTAGGDLCVSEKGADQLKWISVSMEFCQVDPDLFSMINPTWTKLLDAYGETIGWEESHSYSIDTGFALEVWSDVTGYTPKQASAEGAWVYYLLPNVVGGSMGDITVENGAVSFTITGRTKKGSQWGKGPYNVMANPPDGTTGPMITPFSPDAPRRIFLTTVAPPKPTCGCGPLSHPDAPNATVVESTEDTNRMTARAYASGAGPFTVNWGDGTVENLAAGLAGGTHVYGAAGDYTVAIYPTNDTSKVSYEPITVPFAGATPTQPLLISITEVTTDLARRTAKLEWDNGTNGTVRLDWGDGTTTTAQAAVGTANHVYAAAGAYTVRVVDESDATRKDSQLVTVPFGPVLTLTANPNDTTDRRTVDATADNSGKGNVTINWGQAGSPLATNSGDGTAKSTYKYSAAGTYTVTVTDVDDASRTTSQSVTVPLA